MIPTILPVPYFGPLALGCSAPWRRSRRYIDLLFRRALMLSTVVVLEFFVACRRWLNRNEELHASERSRDEGAAAETLMERARADLFFFRRGRALYIRVSPRAIDPRALPRTRIDSQNRRDFQTESRPGRCARRRAGLLPRRTDHRISERKLGLTAEPPGPRRRSSQCRRRGAYHWHVRRFARYHSRKIVLTAPSRPGGASRSERRRPSRHAQIAQSCPNMRPRNPHSQ